MWGEALNRRSRERPQERAGKDEGRRHREGRDEKVLAQEKDEKQPHGGQTLWPLALGHLFGKWWSCAHARHGGRQVASPASQAIRSFNAVMDWHRSSPSRNAVPRPRAERSGGATQPDRPTGLGPAYS